MAFKDRLKQAREKRGLTQLQLAELIGVTKSAIANYETGVSSAKAEVLYKIFSALNIAPNYLFQDEINTDNLEDDTHRMSSGWLFGPAATLLKHFEDLDEEDQNQVVNFVLFLSKSNKYIDENQLTINDFEHLE